MNSKLFWKVMSILALLIIAGFRIYPNIVWYTLPVEERYNQAKRKNPLSDKVISLGLDLQGGSHLVYQLDTSKLPDEAPETVSQAIEQNMLVINNRIDSLGVANPFVARQGNNFIVIQLPGIFESETAKRLIGKTALLEFRLVKDDAALTEILQKIDELEILKDQVYKGDLPAEITELIPEELELMSFRDGGYLLVTNKADLTGKYLKKAYVDLAGVAQVGGIPISFELDSEGADLFEALTGAHVGEQLAIILDGQIQSAPTIRDRIPGGRGQITGTFTDKEARELSNILNSGNLQAPMSVVEERSVGPQMGEDSIHAGMKAIVIGFILVIVFMILFYGFSGFLADLALVMNLIFLVVALGLVGATLTLPGIAGIILSLAMAVDANILILERIREELAKGKQARFAIEEGYDKAFGAIFDGNVTTILAAMFLFQFGTGPVRGFALTLMGGLIVSMLTAFFATRVFYEVWFSIKKPKTLRI